MADLKINDDGQTKVDGSLPVSEYVRGIMSEYAIKALWILVGAVLAFLITQFFGLSTLVHELNGEQQQFDKTIEMLMNERQDSFSILLNLQKNLIDENMKLKEQINQLNQSIK
ncbi:MAG: hypothetical protein WCV72_01350 [Patescibacteria group bacterium]|jgi:hypothetical protein